MMITLLLLFNPLVTAYNLQVDNAIIYEPPYLSNQRNQSSGSFFGFSVLLSPQKLILSNGSAIHNPWIFVGAPKANYTTKPGHGNNKIPEEPGVTYRCNIPNSCVPINVRNPDNENGFIEQAQLHVQIEKEHGWLGAAMSSHIPTNSLIVCAPRTIVGLYSSLTIYAQTMQGVCYKGELYSDDLHIEDKNFTTYDFSSRFWYSPLNGFSVHYPTSKKNIPSDTIQPIIGSPKHELFGSVQKMGQNKIAELPIGHSLAQFGYALTSGYYFNKEQLMMAAGAPGWQYIGQVAILESRPDSLITIVTIKGKEVGEYFGASLATGDINNDGLDDLIVGAPHWKNDNGKVHIFFGDKDGFLQGHTLVLEGNIDDALFGYAVTSGDLDGDGFYDIIVGAPWEGPGVIYVYNGAAKRAELELLKPSQRIAASEIEEKMLRFGFSLSNIVDINGDGTSDVAVGAYESEHVVILRSKPVVKTRITLSTDPQILLPNSTSFKLKVCFDDSSPYIIDGIYKLESVIYLTVDEAYKRVNNETRDIFTFFRNSPKCKYLDIELQKNITNRMDAIKIVVHHEFYYHMSYDDCADTSLNYMGSLCPTEYKARIVTAETEIPFDIGCGMDDICHASIFTKQYFQNIRDSTWIIGSDYLSLVMEIGNFGEAAYQTTVKFHIPTGVNLKSIPSLCQEEEDTERLEVTCEVGNPLERSKKSIILDFDMKGINNGSANGTTLIFSADIKTRSENRGVTKITIPLHLIANVSISLNGMAYDSSYYFENNERPTNFSFLHTYGISRFGVTPISQAFLIIGIPYKVDGMEFLSLLHEPRISVSGQFYGCQVTGVSVIKPHFVDETSFKAKYAISHMIPTNSTQYWQGDRNIESQFYNMINSENIDVNYLNCSADNVICGQVVCKILPLNTAWEVAKLELRLSVTDNGLKGGTDLKEKVFHITTEASVTVVDPDMEFTISGAGIIVPVTTTVLYSPHHRTSKNPGINIWIILGSVTFGLLILCVLAIGLWKFDFFKRSKREELETLKSRKNIVIELDCEEDDVSD